MKKMTKIFSVVFLAIILLSVATTVFAADDNPYNPIDMDGTKSKVDTSKITDMGQSAVRIITTIGMVASVAVLVVLGIKYILGSAEEKAEYKKTLLPYVIGAVLVFAASSIASMVYTFAIGL